MQTNKIDAPESDYLYIAVSQLPNAGQGLYTAITIYKGEVISVFKGEILTNKQAEERANKNEDQYFINRLDGRILDPMYVYCFAKYANDATGLGNTDFKNNTKIALDDDNNICIIATKKIKVGEELFCSYGKRYWKKHGFNVNNYTK